MIDLAFLYGCLLLPVLGYAFMRRSWRGQARAYGTLQHAESLLAAGHAPTQLLSEARRIERAKRNGKRYVRTWRKVRKVAI